MPGSFWMLIWRPASILIRCGSRDRLCASSTERTVTAGRSQVYAATPSLGAYATWDIVAGRTMGAFDFVSDERFRESLESDYLEIQRCLDAEAWKAVHVLAGSIVEAVLIDYLLSVNHSGS